MKNKIMDYIYISHRGNLKGPQPKKENTEKYITDALNLGYNVEIDVWFVKGEYFLGHDSPDYKTNKKFLKNNKLWCHAKNIDALEKMLKDNIHCFWHQNDDVTLTSKNFLWYYPGKIKEKEGIDVMPEKNITNIEKYKLLGIGVCSDYINVIKNNQLKGERS